MRRLRAGSRGSVLILMPAGFLIVIALAAVAVDETLRFQRQREAANLAADIADDLAVTALDADELRRDPRSSRLSSTVAHRRARLLVEASQLADEIVDWRIALDGGRVTVRLVVSVPRVFSPVAGTTTHAQATAVGVVVAG